MSGTGLGGRERRGTGALPGGWQAVAREAMRAASRRKLRAPFDRRLAFRRRARPCLQASRREEDRGKMVGFRSIDGDRTEAGATADYYEDREFVRPGGIIAVHDIVERQPHPTNQVHRPWKRIEQEAVTEELVDDPAQCGFGIGIVRVPG